MNQQISDIVDGINAVFLAGMRESTTKGKLSVPERQRIHQIRGALGREVANGTDISEYETVFLLNIIKRLTT